MAVRGAPRNRKAKGTDARRAYLNALRRADGGDAGPLAEIFARAVTDGIYRFLLRAWRGRIASSRSGP